MMDKIFVGALDEKQKMSGIYFDDSQFTGMPNTLRVPFDHWTPKGEYDQARKSYIEGTLAKVNLSAWNEDAVKYALKAPDPAIREIALGNIKLMNLFVIVPDKKDFPKEYDATKKIVDAINGHFDQDPTKDLVLSGCECHVVPLSADYGAFKGMQLALFNLASVEYSFVKSLKG